MIRVLLRIRRMTDGERNEPARCIPSYQWYGGQIISVGAGDQMQSFKFKYIFDQEDDNYAVFEPVKEIIKFTLDGLNSTVFAYGQTGSGKTYTISGGPKKSNGMIQQTFRFMREQMLQDSKHDYEVKCSMIQIYQSDLVDLLRENDELPRELSIRVDDRNLIYV